MKTAPVQKTIKVDPAYLPELKKFRDDIAAKSNLVRSTSDRLTAMEADEKRLAEESEQADRAADYKDASACQNALVLRAQLELCRRSIQRTMDEAPLKQVELADTIRGLNGPIGRAIKPEQDALKAEVEALATSLYGKGDKEKINFACGQAWNTSPKLVVFNNCLLKTWMRAGVPVLFESDEALRVLDALIEGNNPCPSV